MLHVVIPLLIGALVGLLSALLTKSRAWTPTLVDIAAGIGGAVPVAWFVEPLGNGQSLNRPELIGALFGAVFLVAVATLFTPLGKARR